MSSSIQNILHTALGDGARSTKFDALFQFTGNDPADSQSVTASVKTASFPSKSHNIIPLKYKGRPVPVRGSVKYTQNWDCTFYLTEDHSLKNAFEMWIEALDEKHNYDKDTGNISSLKSLQSSTGYYRDLVLFQGDFEGDDNTAKYTLYNAFPIAVSPVSTSYEGPGTILEFTVTFAYTHFSLEVLKSSAGNFIDNMVDTANEIAQGVVNSLSDSITTFVNDAVGNTLNELNDFANGITTEISTASYSELLDSLNSGGLGAEFMPTSLIKNNGSRRSSSSRNA